MRLFGIQLFGSASISSSARDPSDEFWWSNISNPVAAGVDVTVDTAITVPVVYDCLKVLSETIGTLPFAIYERVAEKDKQRRDQHPLVDVFNNPGDDKTSVEFFQQLVWDLASTGNGYHEIVPGPRGPIGQLIHMDPKHTTVERLPNRAKRYRYREPGQPERILSPDQVWHVAVTPMIDGLVGTAPIHAGREAIGQAIALQQYAASFFKNSAVPPYIIEHPGNFKDGKSRRNYLEAIRRWWGGKNRHSPAVLEYGAKATKLGTSNEEAQFLQTRKENALDLTRIWHMQPHKVGVMDNATFTNIEQQSLEFVIDTLLPWIRLIEKSIRKHLIFRPKQFFFEFNVAGLLRGDIKTRYQAYAIGRNGGWLSVNEIRGYENLNPVADGDTFMQPMNMTEIGQDSDDDEPEPEQPPNSRAQLNGAAALERLN